MPRILDVRAREVLDSRGNPTVEAEVRTEGGFFGWAIVPSGASTGKREAVERRDGGKRFSGKGVLKAVEAVNSEIRNAIVGMDAKEQREIDQALISLDGTPQKSKLGANAILAVSLAVCRASASALKVPLHERIAQIYASAGSVIERKKMPTPMFNVINGGKHAGNELSIQEFLIIPTGFERFSDKLRAGAEIYHALKGILERKYGKIATNVGDEGGYAPPMRETVEALDALSQAIAEAGYGEGGEVKMGMDAAASTFFNGKTEKYEVDGWARDGAEMVEFYKELAAKYPIILLEDPFHEDSYELFAELTREMPEEIIVGDDLFVTSAERLREGIEKGAGNAVLLKLNQVGTLTETMETAVLAEKSGFKRVVSHRSGDTEDAFIADFSVGIAAELIKSGAPARGERTCKYNQLLRIEEQLSDACY